MQWTLQVGSSTATRLQKITRAIARDNPQACCEPGMKLVPGSNGPDVLAPADSGNHCVFGYGGHDVISTQAGKDYQSAGQYFSANMSDYGGNDTMVGGALDDVITAYGSGHRLIFGDKGNDVITLWAGSGGGPRWCGQRRNQHRRGQ